MPSPPIVAVIGLKGFIGKMVYQPLLDAKKEGRIAELRAFGRSFDDEYKQELEKAGFKTHLVDYSDEKTLLAALKGVNCLLSCMGAQGDFNESKHALLEAAIKSKVQVYIPSEFGTDHNALKEHGDFPMFAKKRKHFKESQAAGIKTVGIFTSLILEYTFFKRSGFDNEKEQWTVCGKANGAKVSLSSEIDVGKYTVEALLLAYNDPEKCPEHVRIYSTNMTMQDYADGFDAVAGRKTTITETSLDDAVATYIRLRPTLPSFQVGPLIPVMLATGGFDHESNCANKLLNDGKWKPKTFEEYAKEVNGRPWTKEQPFAQYAPKAES